MMKAAVTQQKWFALEITVVSEAVEAIEHAFNSLDSLGTEIDDMPRNRKENVTVIGYFDDLPDDEILQDEVHYALRIYGLNEDAVRSISHREVENADWLLEWKKHWKPTEIGRFVIAPPWEKIEDSGRIAIRIEPNMAFGTGTHETTQLCLRAIEHAYRPGDSFLDVGTGTGILAIAAAKLTAEGTDELSINSGGPFPVADPLSAPSVARFLACDTDADAIKIAAENAAINGVGEAIEFIEGTLPEDAPAFDFVCANLTVDAILPILELLLAKTDKTLVLSGILDEQEHSIVSALNDLNVVDQKVERAGEWVAVSCQNRERKRVDS